MNEKFMSGPWTVCDGAILSEKLNAYGNWIICGLDRARTDEDEANLRLIAAAPELLAACRGMLEWARRVKENNPGMEVLKACQAIARAEGVTL